MSIKKKRRFWPVTIIVLIVLLILGIFWIKTNLYASPFDPTQLTPSEQLNLDNKLSKLKSPGQNSEKAMDKILYTEKRLDPEPYFEDDSRREIKLSEKELNSLITDPEIAKRVAVDLSDDLLSVKMIIPMDERFPILGGKKIKLSFGTTLAYMDNNLVVAMRGISIGGVPLPSAWWGGIKNQNLVEYFGNEGSFWNTLAAGISDITIRENELYVKLKE